MSAEASPPFSVPESAYDAANEFQTAVERYLIRHRSILDILAKLQDASSRVQRAVAKSVTSCGCVTIDARRQSVPEGITYTELKQHVHTHVDGELCEQCSEVIEAELGQNLFYVTAVCETLGLQMSDVLQQEKKRLETLGVYNLK